MGLHLGLLLAFAPLLAALPAWLSWGLAQGILGLGFVIFVHELGHFAVAKLCGVKCEKFYLGFDIGGLKLARFQWGETEYGIGILPLGGYVKMLGQDDNPGRAEEERRRSTLTPETPAENEEGVAQTLPGLAHSPTPTNAPLDPRSYMAKSVPQRMAIISAGVIMNVIFAFLMATWAYWLGVPEEPCATSALMPGGAAWRAGLQPGDRILQINDREGTEQLPLRFRDLKDSVTLSGNNEPVRFKVKREGVEEPVWMTITPDPAKPSLSLAPTIGAAGPWTTELRTKEPVEPNSPAAATKAFKPGDQIVAINGQPVNSYQELEAQLVRNSSRPIEVTVERHVADTDKTQTEKVEVPPRPRRWLGIVMRLGKITAIQAGSPAEKAGLKVDDFIVSIDGQPPGDINLMALPEMFRSRAGETVTLGVSRKNPTGQDTTINIPLTPRDTTWFEGQTGLVQPEAPLTIPALGIAVKVLNRVQGTEPDSPAMKAVVMDKATNEPAKIDRLRPGDEILAAEFIPSAENKETEAKNFQSLKISFVDDKGNPIANWPFLISLLQALQPDTQVKLTLQDDRYVVLQPEDSPTEFNPDRGFQFKPEMHIYQAQNLRQAVAMGGEETWRSLTQVYSFLRRLGSRISVFAAGGPGTILMAASDAADRGFPRLLLFLTMLSANLAVINFLPIPVLDGGHMVFLTLEAIFRRPVSEKVVALCQWTGLLFILSLMIFVISLDIGLIPRF